MNSNQLRDLINLFSSFGLRHLINDVTRPGKNGSPGTCIDNIVTNLPEYKCSAKVVPYGRLGPQCNSFHEF